jgi:hypothetical protein
VAELTAEQKKVNAAIDRGVAYLKSQLDLLNRADTGSYYEGLLSLIGLTLLECGVPADDPALRKAAAAVRSRAARSEHTYSLSLAVLFLDRLGDPGDRGLIRSLALRLVAGQTAAGNWSYTCHALRPDEEGPLMNFLKSRSGPGPDATGLIDQQAGINDLPARLQKLAVVQAALKPPGAFGSRGDGSNTQFAVLALWVARRHGLPVGPVVALTDRYYRSVQNADGSWGYQGPGDQWRDSMTCAGLLALAVGRTAQDLKPGGTPARDAAVEKGFQYLGGKVDPPRRRGYGSGLVGADAHGDLYFLWSLERVAMVYDLKTVGGKDWYGWAARAILGGQRPDGSWDEVFRGPIDTSFALLVLKRVNVAHDLTTDIKKVINIKELGRATGGGAK